MVKICTKVSNKKQKPIVKTPFNGSSIFQESTELTVCILFLTNSIVLNIILLSLFLALILDIIYWVLAMGDEALNTLSYAHFFF